MAADRRDLTRLLDAVLFAAERHRDQRRKGLDASPYVNHTVEVAHLLATVGDVADTTTLIAALLHDTIEDTDTTAAELEARFGSEVGRLVEEMSDDKSLPWEERKRLQIENVADASSRAKLIKLADKISNVQDVIQSPPRGWSVARRRQYLDWSAQVIAGCRGTNRALEELYDQTLAESLQALEKNGQS